MTEWSNHEDKAVVRNAAHEIVDVAETTAKTNGTSLTFKYSNYSLPQQDPHSSYGAENLERLGKVANKVDPKGIFQSLRNSSWLVSRAGSK
ncbi:FAD-binding domain-containing protein [Penicillium waksmanii]|uniref:FAD-binding domain-containing protein n=1 Tax=Penicillium waksmanii TaxID=69791 RepID=UPI0025471713|nr:FAD-binding domain-containing protein [Penicillium waksmanii]KAJ5988460.1 FAD-binding domain-containing protein [Penicillium waksmanii]